MENKVKYKLEADFEGWFWTAQEDLIGPTGFKTSNSSHEINIYRGHVTNVKLLDPTELTLKESEIMLNLVRNIQIEPGGEWLFENPRIFDFYQFNLDNVKFSNLNLQNSIFSSKNRNKNYCKISGRLTGTILERSILPPVTPKTEECLTCSQNISNNGGVGVQEQIVRLGKDSGKTYIEFKPQYKIDMLEIFYMGSRVWSTHQITPNENGFVGGNLDKKLGYPVENKWGAFDYIYNVDDYVTVRVTGKDNGTVWDYTLYCPNVVPPNADLTNSEYAGDKNILSSFNKGGCLKWLWYILLLLLLLYLLKQCTSLGKHASCWYEKSKYERKLKEYEEEYNQTEKEIKDTEKDKHPCASKDQEGEHKIDIQYYDLGDKSGIVKVRYDMYQVEDMIEVYYDGEMVGSSSGLVVGKGNILWNYNATDGRPSRFMVKIIPGPVKTTKWRYDLICP